MGRILVAIAAVALAVFFRVEAADYRPAASRFPDVVGLVLIFLSIVMIAQVLTSWGKAASRETLTVLPKVEPYNVAVGMVFVLLAMAYAWSIQTIGYLIATPVFLLIALAILRPVKWPWIIGITSVVTAAIWGIFIFFLNLPILLYPGS